MSLYPQFNLFWVRTQGTMTNFVIVYCLPEGSQAQVLHGRRGAAVGILSGPYSTLYHFRRVPWGGRRQDSVRVSVKCMQPLSTV